MSHDLIKHIDKKVFLEALEYFYSQARKNTENGTIKDSEIAATKHQIDEALKELKLKCAVSFGSGNTARQQGIAFVREDTLGKEYVNGEKPTPKNGIYIWFDYLEDSESKAKLRLEFGFSLNKAKEDCEAFDRMKDNGCFGNREGKFRRFYPDIESSKNIILQDFLEFVGYYTSFHHSDFKFRSELNPGPNCTAETTNHTDVMTGSIDNRPIVTVKIVEDKEYKTKD